MDVLVLFLGLAWSTGESLIQDKVIEILKKRFEKDYLHTFVTALEKAVELHGMSLKKHSPSGEVAFQSALFKTQLDTVRNLDKQLTIGAPSSFLIQSLAHLFWEYQFISIDGHHLSEADYKALSSEVLGTAREIFWEMLTTEQRTTLLLRRVDNLEESFKVSNAHMINQLEGVEYRLRKVEDSVISESDRQAQSIDPQIRYRLLVNSAQEEALAEREAILGSLRASQQPLDLNASGSSESQVSNSKRLVAQADLVVTVFTERYGNRLPSGRSHEHDVYLSVVETHKPHIVYIKDSSSYDEDMTRLIAEVVASEPHIIRYYSSPHEIQGHLLHDVTQVITTRFAVTSSTHLDIGLDYLGSLQKEIQAKKALQRSEVLELLEHQLASVNQVMVIGEPGIGKTFVLGQFAANLRNSIYISLKTRSKYQIFAYLANKLRSFSGDSPLAFTNELEARSQFEAASYKVTCTILVDDVDSHPEYAAEILGIAAPATKIVLAARSSTVLGDYPIRQVDIEPLSHVEIRQFLSNMGLDIGPRKFADLANKSEGNPLYLYYFSVEQIEPLPESILDYQAALWRKLPSAERDILALIALSVYRRSIPQLHEARKLLGVSVGSPMETSALIETMIPIVRLVDSWIEIFHPLFTDYVIEQIEASGLADQYHTILGEVSLKYNLIVDTAYHFDIVNDQRAQTYYLPAARMCILSGDYDLAEHFLNKLRQISQESPDAQVMGDIYFCLALLFSETGRLEMGKDFADKAVDYLHAAGDKHHATHIDLWRSAAFLELMDRDETIKRAEDIVRRSYEENLDEETLAVRLVNLANIQLRSSYFRKGLESAEKAYKLFAGLQVREGMITALTNINMALANIADVDNERIYEHANSILELADELNLPRLRIVGLNQLALYQRRANCPEDAIVTLGEVITLCQRIQDPDREALNLNNMGNAYVDLEKYSEAENCYLEAISVAEEHSITREVARAYELLVRLKLLTDEYQQAIELGPKAIKLYESIGEQYRIASTLEYLGWVYGEMNDPYAAAESYQRAAEIYEQFGELDALTYYEKASQNWLMCNELGKSLECAYRSIGAFSERPLAASADSYQAILRYSLEAPQERGIGGLILLICALLKRDPDATRCKQTFIEITELLKAKYVATHSLTILNAILILVDQADETLLSSSEFDHMANALVEIVDGLYRRRLAVDHEVYTVGMRWKNDFIVQITAFDEGTFVRRMALSLALALIANSEYLEAEVVNEGGPFESDFSLNITSLSAFREYVMPLDDGPATTPEMPFTITESNVPWTEEQPEAWAILYDNYSAATDWDKHPGNKAFVWVLMVLYGAFVGHCTHNKRDKYAKQSRKFAEMVLS